MSDKFRIGLELELGKVVAPGYNLLLDVELAWAMGNTVLTSTAVEFDAINQGVMFNYTFKLEIALR